MLAFITHLSHIYHTSILSFKLFSVSSNGQGTSRMVGGGGGPTIGFLGWGGRPTKSSIFKGGGVKNSKNTVFEF